MNPEQDLTPSPEKNLMTAVTKLQNLGQAFQAETGLPASRCMLCTRTDNGVTKSWFEALPVGDSMTWMLFSEALFRASQLPADHRAARTQQNIIAIISMMGCPDTIIQQAKRNLDLL